MWRAKQCRPPAHEATSAAFIGFVVAAGCVMMPGRVLGAEAVASIAVKAQVSTRTSLKVSTQILQFNVVAPDEAATASIDFSAGSRTNDGANVVLTIELERANGDMGALAPGTGLSFSGQGEGTRADAIAPTRYSVAARWAGSGHRSGRLVFTLRMPSAGTYTVPVRLMLTAP